MKSLRTPLLLAIWALGLGLVINFCVTDPFEYDDERAYQELASHWNATGEFGIDGKRAERAPTFPWLLSVAYRIGGESKWTGRVVQSVLNAVAVVLAYYIGRKLADYRSGLLAALLLQLDSFWWWSQFHVMTESLQAVLVAASLLLLLWAWRSGKAIWWGAVGAGALFGLALLVKPNMLPTFFLLGLAPLVVSRDQRAKAFRLCATFGIAALLVCVPWMWRNYTVFERFVPFTTGSGHVFWGAHWPGAEFRGEWTTPGAVSKVEMAGYEPETIERLSPNEKELMLDRLGWIAGWKEVRRRGVSEMLIHEAYKGARFFSPSVFFGTEGHWSLAALKCAAIGLNVVVLLSFFAATFSRRFDPWIAWLYVGGALITCLIFWGTIRFRYPLAPVIVGYAAAWLISAWRALWNRRPGDETPHPSGT